MRDLKADLRLCEGATPGPWEYEPGGYDCHNWECSKKYVVCNEETEATCPFYCQYEAANIPEILTIDCGNYDGINNADAEFIAASREGWPEAIRRALEAEKERDELRAALQEMVNVVNRAIGRSGGLPLDDEWRALTKASQALAGDARG